MKQKAQNNGMPGRNKDGQQGRASADQLNEYISEYIRTVGLRKALFGVNEEDVWTVVSNIQKYYEIRMLKDAAVIEKLTKSLAAKDELIAKQRIYVEAARRMAHDTQS